MESLVRACLPGLEQKWMASQPRGQRTEIQVLAGLAPSEACLMGSRTAVLPLYPFPWFFSVCLSRCQMSPFNKETSHTGLGSTLVTLF